ncbi:S-adenosyl-L-methionine-dependent methyltransferase [Trametes polyzona]|nr:S-adenosyl-L-methionine-dependent methyltransferase [Trametes polyzona]
MSEVSPIVYAEELLQLVKALHPEGQPAGVRDAQAYETRKRVQRLCNDITRSVCGPLEYTVLLAESCHESAALRLVTEYGVADAIGNYSKSLADICEEVKVNFRYLDVAMKCLVSHGYFEEIGGFNSRVFKNNAMSDVLRKDHPQTLKDAVGFICDDGGKAASYLSEAARAPDNESKGSAPALNLAFGFEGPVFQHWADGAHAWRGKRLGQAMKQLHQMANGNVVVEIYHPLDIGPDFDWAGLQSPVVDVGGGIGALELALVRAYPDSTVNFVVVDLAETLKNARTVWETQSEDARRRVSFVAGDFLAPTLEGTRLPCGQPTYLIRHVLHDWTDEQVIAILRNVRAAMLAPPPPPTGHPASDSGVAPVGSARRAPKLLVCEMLLQERSGRFAYTTSLQVLALNNGIIRTEAEMVALLEKAGFTVAVVHAMRAVDTIIEATPAE